MAKSLLTTRIAGGAFKATQFMGHLISQCELNYLSKTRENFVISWRTSSTGFRQLASGIRFFGLLFTAASLRGLFLRRLAVFVAE